MVDDRQMQEIEKLLNMILPSRILVKLTQFLDTAFSVTTV